MQEAEQGQHGPSLSSLLEDTFRLFNSKTTIINEYGREEGYISHHAVEEAIRESGYEPKDIFLTLVNETKASPQVIFDDDIQVSDDSWKDFYVRLGKRILDYEFTKAHPELTQEDEDRLNWEPELVR